MKDEKFIFGKDVSPKSVGEGLTRKILAHSDTMMMVEMDFEAGSIGTPHVHPHEQMTYILSGEFRFTNDGETRDVGPGDSLRFAPGTEHGTVCLQAGSLIDIFTPCREDFLES